MVAPGHMDLANVQTLTIVSHSSGTPGKVTRVDEQVPRLHDPVRLINQVVIHLLDRGEDFPTLGHVSQDGFVTEMGICCEPDVTHLSVLFAAALTEEFVRDVTFGERLRGVLFAFACALYQRSQAATHLVLHVCLRAFDHRPFLTLAL